MARCSSTARRTKWHAIHASRRFILARSSMPELLAIERLCAGYGEAVVLSNISLSLREGQALALLGRNGMGKTTLINTIVGVTRYFGGTITLDGAEITSLRPDQRAHAGIGWVPQERNIFQIAYGRGESHRGGAAGPLDHRKSLWLVSAPCRAAAKSRQPAVRWRAANARGRTRAGAQSAHHAARRTVGRVGADHRRGTIGGAAPDYPRGRHVGHSGRAERQEDSRRHSSRHHRRTRRRRSCRRQRCARRRPHRARNPSRRDRSRTAPRRPKKLKRDDFYSLQLSHPH